MAGLPIVHNLEMPTILPVREYTAFTEDLIANRKISSKKTGASFSPTRMHLP